MYLYIFIYIYIYLCIFIYIPIPSVCPSVRKRDFFTKSDVFNYRLRLNETTKVKIKYMSILVILIRVSMLYLRTIGKKLKPSTPFV